MQKRILSLLVDNTAGVLSRISGLFSRRGYNIDSLTVGVTADERFSRMTVVCSGDSMILEQITKQLAKLVDVRDIKVLEPDNSVSRELVLAKVAARPLFFAQGNLHTPKPLKVRLKIKPMARMPISGSFASVQMPNAARK